MTVTLEPSSSGRAWTHYVTRRRGRRSTSCWSPLQTVSRRNYVHQMVILEELEHGISVVFIDRPRSDDPHEQLVLQIRGAVAEYERTLMSRGRQAKLKAARLLPWTIAPYGYRIHPDRPRDPALVEMDEAGAAIVRELFPAYADGEATLHALATPGIARWQHAICPFVLGPPRRICTTS